MYKEILRLKNMLEEAKIPFRLGSFFDGYHIVYPKARKACVCSTVEHKYSYGHEQDLLEIMGLLTDSKRKTDNVAGYLTAEDVFSRIKADFDRRNR